jgi:YbbR domain-containing protein
MKIPTNDLFLMILSGVLSLFLWLWVGAEERSEIIVSVPLEYRNLPKDYEITTQGELVSKVNVWVKGSTATVKNLQPQEISVWLDLGDTRPGERLIELTTENVRVPYGFSVLRISPSRMNIRVEQVTRKMVPVVPKIEGQPPQGFTVTNVNVTPAQIEILGPSSAVNSVKRVITESIDVSNLTQDHQETVTAGAENTSIRLGKVKQVNVVLKVSEIEDLLTLKQIPITLTENKHQIRISPKVVKVDFQAPKRLLARISEDHVQAILDVNGLTPGVYELTPRIVYSNEEKKISLINVKPPRIHVKIQ